ncbi:uncharacterized protein LOC123469645 [Daphnia magna]|uniref:uncharacterized protein LOC123469645 n=1 Tax=Daphnia magna TaxID=35525 RepID=UPI001E1BDC07|nr:uncharacterized protein LOC123469645 [Daphnia magna]XP_045024710.1 uncharacterized protein LOC123469645 [Daphnia magna]XP_045024711.1 uncharacterized protein LOC123469645 [Daphnia magna]
MMNLDTHQLCPSLSPSLNGPTGNTSTNGTTGMTFDQSMTFRLLNAIERVTSLENAIGTIEANVSATLALILEKLGALDQKIEAIRKVEVYKMAEVDFDYHKSVIDTHFKELPVKSTNAVEAIDFSLQDNTLAISLVFFSVEKFKTVKTVNKLFYLMLDFLVSKEVSNKMQWKMMPRGKDSRPGMAGLFNLLAVFGVAATTFAKKKGEQLNEGRIQQLVRDARKTHAREFRATSRGNEQAANDAPATAAGATQIQDNDGVTLKEYSILHKNPNTDLIF